MDNFFLERKVSAQPGAAMFRSILAIVVIVICISVYFSFTDSVEKQSRKIAKDRVINDIKYSLSMMLYDFTIKGKQKDLNKFHLKNPIVPLGIYRAIPANYIGTALIDEVSDNNVWFYDNQLNKLIYIANNEKLYWQLRFIDKGVGQLVLIEVK